MDNETGSERESAAPIRMGAAGRLDDATRSDCRVVVEPDGGGHIAIDSKVGAYFGRSIRETVAAHVAAFAAESASIQLDDRGALPFVLSARLEGAFRRAGFTGSAPSGESAFEGEPTEKNRLRRSRLYLPGNEPKFMINAGLHRPDAVILDLEDSVHADEKDTARLVVRNALRAVDFMGAERMVRINQLPLGFEDLDEIVPASPDLVLLPKAERAEDVVLVAERIAAIQAASGQNRPIWLMPILESALGIEHASEIAAAVDSVAALTIGLEDYTADLGVPKTKEGAESLYARRRLVNAARAARVQAIDSVYGDVADSEGLTSWAERSRAMGFEGMGCIHPRQIEPIHRAFAPTPAELEKALAIVAAFNEAQARGLSVVSLGSRMVDPPVVRRALRLVEDARRVGLLGRES